MTTGPSGCFDKGIMPLQPVTYELPACWASYIINGDDSGIDSDEKEQANAFPARNNLPAPVSCSDESHFSWTNDSGNGLAGDVLEYTFLVEPTTPAPAANQCPYCSHFQ
jgi:hypothetical protein